MGIGGSGETQFDFVKRHGNWRRVVLDSTDEQAAICCDANVQSVAADGAVAIVVEVAADAHSEANEPLVKRLASVLFEAA